MSPRTEAENERIREERRQMILDAAAKVFARWGYSATKIAEIATAAGVSHGLVYHYFPSKERIFAALIGLAMKNGLETTREALEQPGTPWERIAGMVRTMVMAAQYAPDYYAVIHQALISDAVPAEIRKSAREQGERCQEEMARVIAEGQAAGQVIAGDPGKLGAFVYAFVQGLALTSIEAVQTLGPEDVEAVLRVIGKS